MYDKRKTAITTVPPVGGAKLAYVEITDKTF